MKNSWPIALIVFFIVMIAGLVGFAAWTAGQREDLVSANYYEDELRYQTRIDAAARTKAEGADPRVLWGGPAGGVGLQFPPELAAAVGTITMYRPSQANMDKEFTIKLDETGFQKVPMEIQPGFWRVKMAWSVASKQYFSEQSLVVSP